MAVPNMTNNSPAAGQIAWDLFHIQYEGVGYEVLGGSTSDRWVWWRFNGGSPLIQSGPDVPSDLSADDLLLFANKNGIAVRVQNSNLVDGEMIVDGSILADAIAVNQINSNHIITAGLDAGVIKFGVMSGDRINVNTLQGDRLLANTITASKLAITDWENYITDPFFKFGRWTYQFGGNPVTASPSMPAGMGTGNLIRIDAALGTTRTFVCNDMFPLAATETLRSTVWVRKITNASSPTGSLRLRLYTYDVGGASSSTEVTMLTSAMVMNTWYQLVIDPYVVPANRVQGSLELALVGVNAADDFDFAVPTVNKKSNGQLIIDGTLLAKSIKSGDITTLQLGAGAVTADKVAAKAIDVSKLNVGDLTNYVVDGDLSDATSANWEMNKNIPGMQLRVDPAGDFPYLEGSCEPSRTTFFRNEHLFEIHAGDEYWIEFEVSTPASNVDTLNLNVGLETFDVDGASLLWRTFPAIVPVVPNTGWTKISGALQIASDDIGMGSGRFNAFVGATTTAGQKLRMRKISVRKRNNGSLIVDGSIQASHLDIDSVSAGIVNTQILQSQLAITGNLTIADANMGWSADGLYLGDDVVFYGDSRTNRIEGDLVTESITVKDGLSIGGNADVHGTVVASNGVPTPTAKLALSQTWPKMLSPGIGGDGKSDQSNVFQDMIDYTSTLWLTVFNYLGAGIRKIDKATGAFAGDFPLGNWMPQFYPNGGITSVGTDLYIVGSDGKRNGDYYIYRVNSTGSTKLSEIRLGAINVFNSKRVRLISDGTRVGLIWATASSGTLMLRWYTSTLSGASGSDINLMNSVGNVHVGGAHYGVGQAGGTARIWVSLFTGDSNMVRCWTTAGVRVTAEDFPRASNSTVQGLSYDSNSANQRLVSLDKYGYLYTYSQYVNGGTLNAQQTYYDGDSAVYPAGTVINGVDKSGQVSGPHETPPSPVTSFALAKRAWPTITATPAPDELVTASTQVDKADRIGLYASVGGTPMLQAYLAKGVRTIPLTDQLLTTGTAAGASAVPSFATASVPAPGRFRSSAILTGTTPVWDLQGSGDGRVGPIYWDALGRRLDDGSILLYNPNDQASATATFAASERSVRWMSTNAGLDPSGIFTNNNAVGSIGNVTVNKPGLYQFHATFSFASNTTGTLRVMNVKLNNSGIYGYSTAEPSAAGGTSMHASGILRMAAGDYLNVSVNHNATASLAIFGASTGICNFQIKRIGD